MEKSLAAKIAEACDAVGGVEKKGTNEAQRYKYVKAADIAKAIRHELFGRGIVLLQDESDPVFADIVLPPDRDGKPRTALETRICITFTVTDGVTSYPLKAWGVARDSGDKGIWKAKTGALKYFLRGLGLIPDEKDDPEYDGKGRTVPADEGELHEEESESLTIAGEILEEKETKDYIWYKLKTLVDDGREAVVFVKSPVASDSGRLADRVGHLVSLKVRPSAGGKGSIFVLLDVLQVRKPSSTGEASTEQPVLLPPEPEKVAQKPANAKQGASGNPTRPSNETLRKQNTQPSKSSEGTYKLSAGKIGVIYGLGKRCQFSDDQLHKLVQKLTGKEHISDLSQKEFETVRDNLDEYLVNSKTQVREEEVPY